MKIIKSNVSILPQFPQVEGMFKHIERVGRVAYKSEDRITENSYERFVKMIYERGHWAVFNLGTVYMKIPNTEKALIEILEETKPWTRLVNKGSNYLVTTNYRVICQLELDEVMRKYWCEPGNDHYHRVTTSWVCSLGVSHELVRHRILCPVQESTRFINYSKSKFGSEISYILPQWVYKVRNRIGHTIDPLTYEPRDYILDLDGEELWKALTALDRTVAGRDNLWKQCQDEYLAELMADDGEVLVPEEARGCLCKDTKTELCITGYVDDWMYVNPNENSPEKAGFFQLRRAKDAHPDIRVLADDLYDQFVKQGITKLK